MKQVSTLRYLRGHRTQKEIADVLGISVYSLSRLEQRNVELLRRLPVERVDELAAALDATREQILGEEPIPGHARISTSSGGCRHCVSCGVLLDHGDHEEDADSPTIEEVLKYLWEAVAESGSKLVLRDGRPLLVPGGGPRLDSVEYWLARAPVEAIIASIKQREGTNNEESVA